MTYGAANTRPSPLLEKRFFSNISLVTKELREDPSKFGIGKTSCGGSRGLSALEGLVAAIEVCPPDFIHSTPHLTEDLVFRYHDFYQLVSVSSKGQQVHRVPSSTYCSFPTRQRTKASMQYFAAS